MGQLKAHIESPISDAFTRAILSRAMEAGLWKKLNGRLLGLVRSSLLDPWRPKYDERPIAECAACISSTGLELLMFDELKLNLCFVVLCLPEVTTDKYWLSIGVQPTDTMRGILMRAGLITPPPMVVMGQKKRPSGDTSNPEKSFTLHASSSSSPKTSGTIATLPPTTNIIHKANGTNTFDSPSAYNHHGGMSFQGRGQGRERFNAGMENLHHPTITALVINMINAPSARFARFSITLSCHR
ncbi:unnamed protein product [Dovyalis caffra]|uniref:Uncharacterized protein n=1 Tax=Dovyalis caffra TaxID=77055 RepID=A0AAV1R7R2_9ROSI|nr:unnamed protein product [Dovyalis caffra]